MVTPVRVISQQTFLFIAPLVRPDLPSCHSETVSSHALATAAVDWSEVHAVRLLGVVAATLLLLWAMKRMFGGGKR